MLPLKATKLSADRKFTEFKPLIALARHAINLGRAAWLFWSILETNILQVPFTSVVNLLQTICTFLQSIGKAGLLMLSVRKL